MDTRTDNQDAEKFSAWIRLHGKAVFENNHEVKEACMANPIVKGQYETAENPIFECSHDQARRQRYKTTLLFRIRDKNSNNKHISDM